MTTVELMNNLADFLQDVVKDYATQQKKGCLPIEVYAGYPPIRTNAAEISSFIYVLATEFEDKEEPNLSTAKVEIGFSIYDKDTETGFLSLYNLMEHVRQAILKQRTVAEKHRIVLPVKGEIAEDQPFPQWQGKITTEYTIGQPSEEELYW